MVDKLQQFKINLIKEKSKIMNLEIENNKIKNENIIIQRKLDKISKQINNINKYKMKKKRLKLECATYSFFCFSLALFIGPLCVSIMGATNILFSLILSSLLFITMFPTFMFMFANQFSEYKKVSKYLKNNKIKNKEKTYQKYKNKQIKNNKNYNLNRIIDDYDNMMNLNNNIENKQIKNEKIYVKILKRAS